MTPTGETAPGRDRAWNLLKKLGEGDAGEVYLVESLLDRQIAILKRPRRSAFTGDTVRQASQIEREARILSALAALDQPNNRLSAPRLLDQSKPGAEFSERFFIVITRAPGFDLHFLARAARLGTVDNQSLDTSQPDLSINDVSSADVPIASIYLQQIAARGQIPTLILLRAISALIEFLEALHTLEISTSGSRQYGVIWNDIKPGHIFWDPRHTHFTIIDWGNAQFLEADGATTDRQLSRLNDYIQLLSEMGSFLSDTSPELYEKLAWPQDVSPASAYSAGIKPLKERLIGFLAEEQAILRQARQQETELLQATASTPERLTQLAQVHNHLVGLGEIPDYVSAEKFFLRLANSLASSGRLAEFRQLCLQVSSTEHPSRIPLLETDRWCLLGEIAERAIADERVRRSLMPALSGDWPSALWELRMVATQDSSQASWWEAAYAQVRRVYLAISADTLTPFTALNRLIHALQYQQLARTLKEEVLQRWTETEPDPPDSGIEYREIERYLTEANELAPAATQALVNALDQPKAQAKIVIDAWEQRKFETACQALRRVLLWDPDRLRLLLADQALQSAPAWLEQVHQGPQTDEPLQEFITRLELRGRELRNQVGPAGWLDAILNAFARLRKGADATEVLLDNASLRDDLGWLLDVDHHGPILALPSKPVHLERENQPQRTELLLHGVKDGALGQGQDLLLAEALDTWTPEARGSSARVFAGSLQMLGRRSLPVAIKLMRPERTEYALPMFREEVQVLTVLRDVPGVNSLLEFGFIQLDSRELPQEDRQIPANALTGRLLRYGIDSVHTFLIELPARISQGWLPYLATEKHDHANNLLLLCDTSYTRGRFLPILEGLRLAIQICDILEVAHARNIVYRDHKILHYYWLETYNGVCMIDWNIARRYPEGLSNSDIQFDLVQFAARALHPILTGRSAPGALPLGPTRPEEIEAAARSYAVRWTYDDQRLPKELKDILERSLTGGYTAANRLRSDLFQSFQTLSELVPK